MPSTTDSSTVGWANATSMAVIRRAARDIGMREKPPGSNRTPLGEAFGWNGVAWCQIAQSIWFKEAGYTPNVDYPWTAACAAAVSWFKRKGRFGRTPKVGAMIFYGPGGGTHVELVVEVHPTYVVTIGGNTSGSLNGAYYAGDGVYKKSVSRSSSRIYGYGYPFKATGSADDSSSVVIGEDDMPKYISLGGLKSQELAADKWTTIWWDKEYSDKHKQHGDGNYPTIMSGPAYFMSTVGITIEDVPKGTEGQLRLIEVNPKKDMKVSKTYPIQEFTTTSGRHFETYGPIGSVSKGMRLRAQVVLFGRTGKLTGRTVKIFYWDK